MKMKQYHVPVVVNLNPIKKACMVYKNSKIIYRLTKPCSPAPRQCETTVIQHMRARLFSI